MNNIKIKNTILNLFKPEIEYANYRLRELKLLDNDLFIKKDDICEILNKNLEEKLLAISENTLVTHYLIAQKDLKSEKTPEKLGEFCDMLLDNEVRLYFTESFPLLFDLIDNEINQWILCCSEVISKLIADIEEITQTLYHGINLGKIIDIDLSAGDRHNNGKSVTLIKFECNSTLVYIPEKRELHHHFKHICEWIDSKNNFGFYSPEYILKDNYTWLEYIEYIPCLTTDQVKMFYKRSGVILALLYMMDATDFHAENIIAFGEYPVLIDLETFFHPFMPYESECNTGINNSVLKTGLLPNIYSASADIDYSGFSNVNEFKEANNTLKYELDANGEIKFTRKKGFLDSAKNIPFTERKQYPLNCRFKEDLIEGFEKTYETILNNKNYFISLVGKLKDEKIRVLFRHTSTYSYLLKESCHPDILRNHINMDDFLKNLEVILNDYPECRLITEIEKQDLILRNIPYLYTFADSKDLWHNKAILIKDFFKKSGFYTALEKIKMSNKEDLERQTWIINSCLNLKENHNQSVNKALYPLHSLTENTEILSKERILEFAEKTAQKLIKEFNITSKRSYWLVIRPINSDSGKSAIMPSSYDLYSGMPGEIICFLSLAKITGNIEYHSIAINSAEYLYNFIVRSSNQIKETGIFGGWGSIFFLFTLLGKITRNEVWYSRAYEISKKIDYQSLFYSEKNHGITTGASGLILSFIEMYKHTGMKYWLDHAEKLSGLLLRSAYQSKDQIKWKGFSKHPLLGLAHGSSGYALCFSRLFQYTKNEKYKDIALKIVNYENHLYDEKNKNWPDLRDFVIEQNNGNQFFSTAWSHGAPGIGLSRIELLKSGISDKRINKDIKIAIETCLKNGFKGNHNLCYGSFGNLELLINSSIYFKDKDLKNKYQTIGSELIRQCTEYGITLNDNNLTTPGLMNGLTGIIYQCLRMYDPENTPSILSVSA